MAGPTNSSQAKRQRLLDLLPQYDWSIAKAGLAAGYSKTYAETTLANYIKKDVSFCKAIVQRRAEIQATQGDKVEKLVQFWISTTNNEGAALRDRIKASELLGKYHGIFSEKRVLEVGERQRQLSQSEQEEAKRIALYRFNTSDPVPNRTMRHIEGEVIAAQTQPKPSPSQDGAAHSEAGKAPGMAQDGQTAPEDTQAGASTPMSPQTGFPSDRIAPSEISGTLALSDQSYPELVGVGL